MVFFFLASVLLLAVLQAVPIGGAGVPRNVTLTPNNPLLKFSPDWTIVNAFGEELAFADAVGSELQVDQLGASQVLSKWLSFGDAYNLTPGPCSECNSNIFCWVQEQCRIDIRSMS